MNAKIFIYFSDILGQKVCDERNHRVGYLCDIAMKINSEIYPKAASLVIKRGLLKKEFARVDWEDVVSVDGLIRIKTGPQKIIFEPKRIKCDFSLCVDILDQQIVDINNRKVLRVNDIHLLKVDNHLYLAHVDVGIRGLIRRLNWSGMADSLVRIFFPHSSYLTQEDLISWKNTHVLSLGRVKNLLRLDVARQKLTQIPPTELADIIEDLDIFERKVLFRSLDAPIQQKVFADLAIAKKVELIEKLEEKEMVNLIENIPSDEAVDLLLRLPKRKTRQLLKVMETKTSKRLGKLLGFSKDSAGGLMTTEYLALPKEALVKDALQKIKENAQSHGSIYCIYIVDEENRLLGLAPLRNFINADPEAPLVSTADPHRIFVRTDDRVEKVALLLEKYKFSVIPVLNEEDILQGVITIDDVMEELISIAWKKYRQKL